MWSPLKLQIKVTDVLKKLFIGFTHEINEDSTEMARLQERVGETTPGVRET